MFESICLGYVLGPVIQATEKMDFEDGSKMGKMKVRNGFQRIHTKPEVNTMGPIGPWARHPLSFLRGRRLLKQTKIVYI